MYSVTATGLNWVQFLYTSSPELHIGVEDQLGVVVVVVVVLVVIVSADTPNPGDMFLWQQYLLSSMLLWSRGRGYTETEWILYKMIWLGTKERLPTVT